MPSFKKQQFSVIDQIRNNPDKKNQRKLIETETNNRYVVKRVNVEDIIFNESNTIFNSDDTDEEIESLADSIEANGLINPIHLLKQGNKYLLLAGERRTKAHIKKNWRTIPAYVYHDLEEYEAEDLLFEENLQVRELDPRKRFLAFVELSERHERRLKIMGEKSTNAEKVKKLGKMLGVSKRGVERMQQFLRNATNNDIELLRENRISYDEFKRRTTELINSHQKEADQRKAVLAKNAQKANYIDQNTKTVYFVAKDSSGKYSTHMTNAYVTNEEFRHPTLPHRIEKNLAQVDLDILAGNNLWEVYYGDFSEYVPLPSESKETVNAVDSKILDTSSETADNAGSDVPTNDTDVSSPDDNTVSVNSTSPEEDSKDSAEITETPNEEIKGEISDFTGTNLSGLQARGALFTAPNGKVFILKNVALGDQIGNGIFTVRCIAEEVDKNSVKRHDV